MFSLRYRACYLLSWFGSKFVTSMHLPLLHIELGKLAWSAPFLKTFDNMRKLDFFRLPAPRCASMAAGADSLKENLTFSRSQRF